MALLRAIRRYEGQALPYVALAKYGGGDGNRTHVRTTLNSWYYMFIFQYYVRIALKARLDSSDRCVIFLKLRFDEFSL